MSLNPEKLYVFVGLYPIQFLKTVPVQEFWPKILQFDLVVTKVLDNVFLICLSGQLLANKIDIRLGLSQDGSEVKLIVGSVGEKLEVYFLFVTDLQLGDCLVEPFLREFKLIFENVKHLVIILHLLWELHLVEYLSI